MSVIDSHQHFWIQDESDYSWLVPDYGPIYRDFAPPDLRPHLRSAGVEGTIVVQAANSYKDTEYLLRLGKETDWIWGVVGWVPLTDPVETARKLDEDLLGEPLFCGIRHLNHEEPDASWLVRDDVLKGLKELEARETVFDVVAVYPNHLEHLPTIARSHEHLRIVLDHLGKPPGHAEDFDEWRQQLTRAAEFPNVYAKVSGLNTALGRREWTASDIMPPIEHALEVFGTNRLMYGSDWPVLLLAGDYQKVWSATISVLDRLGLSSVERRAVLGENAARVYRLREV